MSRSPIVPVAAVVAFALFAVAFATSLVPWLTRERQSVSSTPTTLSRFALTDVRLRHGAEVCVRGVGIDRTADGLQLRVVDVGKADVTPTLGIEVRAPGYESHTRLAGGYPFGVPVVVPVRRPARDVDGARVCVRNRGKAIALTGTKEPVELAKVRVRLDGRTIVPQPWLTFVRRAPISVLAHAGEILDRVAAFRPFPAVPALLGLLAALVLFGVPIAVVSALATAERADRRDGAP
jgi:hypothetical protein